MGTREREASDTASKKRKNTHRPCFSTSSQPLSRASTTPRPSHRPVMAVLDHHHPGLSDKVNSLYTLSEAWCTSESDRDFGALERAVSDMSPEDFILCVYFFFFFFFFFKSLCNNGSIIISFIFIL